MKKRVFFAAILAAMFLLLAGCSGRTNDFGYVDMQKVITESSKVKELQDEMDKKVNEMMALDEKEKGTLSEADFKKNQQMRQAELTAAGRDMESRFRNLVDKAMADVAKEKKLGAVLAKGSVLHGGVDVTDEVLKKLN